MTASSSSPVPASPPRPGLLPLAAPEGSGAPIPSKRFQRTHPDIVFLGSSVDGDAAAGFVHVANQRGIRTIYVGPEEPLNADTFDEVVLGSATDVLPRRLSSGRPSA